MGTSTLRRTRHPPNLKIRLGSVRSPTSTAKMQASFIRLKLLAVLLFICGAAGFSSTLPAEDALDALEEQGRSNSWTVLGTTARSTMFGEWLQVGETKQAKLLKHDFT